MNQTELRKRISERVYTYGLDVRNESLKNKPATLLIEAVDELAKIMEEKEHIHEFGDIQEKRMLNSIEGSLEYRYQSCKECNAIRIVSSY